MAWKENTVTGIHKMTIIHINLPIYDLLNMKTTFHVHLKTLQLKKWPLAELTIQTFFLGSLSCIWLKADQL